MIADTEILKTSVSEISLENGIIRIDFPISNCIINETDALEILRARTSLPTASKQLILTDLTTNPKPTREAREFAKHSEMIETTYALALLIASPVSRLLGNFFLGFNKGEYPVKLFTSIEEATSWLKSFQYA